MFSKMTWLSTNIKVILIERARKLTYLICEISIKKKVTAAAEFLFQSNFLRLKTYDLRKTVQKLKVGTE